MEPLLCEDPQLAGAIGAAIFAEQHFSDGEKRAMKIHYGYTDGSGDYFITIDNGLCDGCGKCVPACSANILEMGSDDNGDSKAKVSDSTRKKVSFQCPGYVRCCQANSVNCHSVCDKNAISHSW
jgi:ferredoxin